MIEELTRIREEAGWPPLAAPIGQVLASQALLHVLSAERYQTVVDELRDLLAGRYGEPPGEISPQVRRAVELTSDGQPPTPEIPDLAQLREQYAGHRGERGGAAPARALRRRREAAAGDDPRARPERLAGGRRRRCVSRGADPRDRPHRPGVRRRRGDDRGRRPARDRAPDARHRSGAGRGGACAGGRGGADQRGRAGRAARRPRRHSGRGADGRHLLPRALARLAAVRRGGRRGRDRPDALHPRGDEADERGQGRAGRDRPPDRPAERPAGRVRRSSCSSSSRSTAARPASSPCSLASWSRTAARSPSA